MSNQKQRSIAKSSYENTMISGQKLRNLRMIPSKDLFLGLYSRILDNFFVLSAKY